ncbi:hypothetical protein Dda_7955 [Drechslerella dactyloides]|uniref:Protein kinase domain-containing protein n=1 Tax=Drechslerella dactyloides TaxID=74499 RepID=A0AAD6ISZ5_DREDA|nr:hypothetical protein Dda_7955 [Drechslerella dactyloides]
MPMYFEGKKTVPAQPSMEALQRSAKNLSIKSSASPRDSVSSKSIKSVGSSYSSRSSNVPSSFYGATKLSTTGPASDPRDTANTANFTPISTQDVMIFTYGYRAYTDPLYAPGGFETISWDTEKIDETVTHQFLRDRIPSQRGKSKLDVEVGFGDGLTDETYGEWVVQKAKRLFLLLLEFGTPERIFDVVDQSWDDDDLPLEPRNIHRLKLREHYDKALENKFYKRQFSYILKEMPYRTHVEYADEDEVPLVVSYRQKSLGFSFPGDDRVHRPRNKNLMIYRRKVALGSEPNSLIGKDFLAEVDTLRNIMHPHVVDFQASYTYLNDGFVLTTPACDYSLKTFIQNPSSTFKSLNKAQRRRKILGWIHCLADALAYLHDQEITALDIRPRTILVCGDTVYFSDISILTGLDPNTRRIDHVEAERYEYGAPEHWSRKHSAHSIPSTPITGTVRARSFFKSIPMISSSNSLPQTWNNDGDVPSENLEQSASSDNLDRVAQGPQLSAARVGEWAQEVSNPIKASTFSLACIFMDLLTFNAKKKISAFQSYRSVKKGSSRGAAKPDSSFHANLGQVASWIGVLDREVSKRGLEDWAVKSILQICASMFYREPGLRTPPRDVADMFWNILRDEGGMPHCGTDGKLPSKEDLEEAALLGRGNMEWEWPWGQKMHSSRIRSLTEVSNYST